MTEETGFHFDRRRHERRVPPMIDEEVIEMIAEKAAEKAMANMEGRLVAKVVEGVEARFLQRVGKTFVDKLLYLVGALIVSLAYFLNSKGFFHLGS